MHELRAGLRSARKKLRLPALRSGWGEIFAASGGKYHLPALQQDDSAGVGQLAVPGLQHDWKRQLRHRWAKGPLSPLWAGVRSSLGGCQLPSVR